MAGIEADPLSLPCSFERKRRKRFENRAGNKRAGFVCFTLAFQTMGETQMGTLPGKTAAEMRMEEKAAKLRAEIAALTGEKRKVVEDFAPDLRVTTAIRPVRRWNLAYHYASNEVKSGQSLAKEMELAVAVAPFFDVGAWLQQVAKPGHKISVSVQW